MNKLFINSDTNYLLEYPNLRWNLVDSLKMSIQQHCQNRFRIQPIQKN